MRNNRDICIIVVFYNPTISQIINFEHLSNAVDVIAVDNSSKCICTNKLTYKPLYSNKGIAIAQNEGIRIAKEKNYKYILFSDQDSQIDSNFIRLIYQEYINIKRIDKKICMLGPLIIDQRSNREYKNSSNASLPYSQVSSIISSGMFIETSIVDTIGYLREDLFIDYVDCEWCWRARSYDLHIYISRSIKLVHSVGLKYFKIIGVVFGISSSFRYYYQYRNMIILIKENYVPNAWKVKILLRSFLDFLVIPFYSKEGIKCSKYMIKGLLDGLR